MAGEDIEKCIEKKMDKIVKETQQRELSAEKKVILQRQELEKLQNLVAI